MFAVVEILGQQFKVHKDQKLIVNKLDEKEGSEVFFENFMKHKSQVLNPQ